MFVPRPAPLDSSIDLFSQFIDALPYGVMISSAIQNENEDIVDFEHTLFNKRAEQDLPGLQDWYPGATLWELFREDAANGLFAIYKHVFESNTVHKSTYYSPVTKLWYHNLIQPFDGGILAVGKVHQMCRKAVVGSGAFAFKLAQYKAAVYEAYGVGL